jgi:hypothetical protein
MRIEEAAKRMTKQYLSRVLDSFTKDLGKFDEEQARDYITRNSEELAKSRSLCLAELITDADETMRTAFDCRC